MTAIGQGTASLPIGAHAGVQGPADPIGRPSSRPTARTRLRPRLAAAARPARRVHQRSRRPAGGAAPTPPVFQDVASTEIPGVIAAGQHWKILWEDKGNNADGIVAFDDGSVWLAQNDKSDIVRVDKDGKASVTYTDTYTGGSIAANSKRQIFVGERALGNAIWTLKPQRKLFANNTTAGRSITSPASSTTCRPTARAACHDDGRHLRQPQGRGHGTVRTVGGNGIILSPG
jgi:hypothetical protein